MVAANYAAAVRAGTMAAARLHRDLKTEERLQAQIGSVDIFASIHEMDVPLILRPLRGLLGAYLSEPYPGILVTTERSLKIQRFTAAHELGHCLLKHNPSLDDETILRRMAMSGKHTDLQEVEADSFAVAFAMPRWLLMWHCERQKWHTSDLGNPFVVYQLSLRMGVSYTAITWTLQRYGLVTASHGDTLRSRQTRDIKVALLEDFRPGDYRGDVWELTERDAGTYLDGSRNDHFVLRLAEHAGGGYLWNAEELTNSGFAVIRDGRLATDDGSVGGLVHRNITGALVDAGRGRLVLDEARPWQPAAPLNQIEFDYDFTGPEVSGLSRAERRHLLEAA